MVFIITAEKQATSESGAGCYCHEPDHDLRIEAFRTLGWKSHAQRLVGYPVGAW